MRYVSLKYQTHPCAARKYWHRDSVRFKVSSDFAPSSSDSIHWRRQLVCRRTIISRRNVRVLLMLCMNVVTRSIRKMVNRRQPRRVQNSIFCSWSWNNAKRVWYRLLSKILGRFSCLYYITLCERLYFVAIDFFWPYHHIERSGELNSECLLALRQSWARKETL